MTIFMFLRVFLVAFSIFKIFGASWAINYGSQDSPPWVGICSTVRLTRCWSESRLFLILLYIPMAHRAWRKFNIFKIADISWSFMAHWAIINNPYEKIVFDTEAILNIRLIGIVKSGHILINRLNNIACLYK